MSIVARTKVFVGLDYHSGSVQVCVMDGQGKVLLNRSYANGVFPDAGLTRNEAEQPVEETEFRAVGERGESVGDRVFHDQEFS